MVNTYRIARALAAMPPPRRQLRMSRFTEITTLVVYNTHVVD